MLSIVIPTYGRDEVLLDTIRSLLVLPVRADEILVVDQTIQHNASATQQLQQWDQEGEIRWIKRSEPSIPKAMNHGLLAASGDLVLFLDDDIVPEPQLVSGHKTAHNDRLIWAVVGQVIQPWQQPQQIAAPHGLSGLRRDYDFPFHSTREDELYNVMAGNLSVKRDLALSIGGFDEQFLGSAYRFETEFARRVRRAGGQIRFAPAAGIKHLRVPSGGTRKRGDHRASADPRHGVGDYYYSLMHGGLLESTHYNLHRIVREVCTKFHLARPWYIPVKLTGEVRAWCWARQMKREGAKLIPESHRYPGGSPNQGESVR